MCGLYAFAGLVLSLRLTQLSVASDSTHKNVLKIKQHWVDSEKKQNLPQLKLFTVQANKTDMCVRVRVRMKPPSHNKTVQIEFTELASNNSQNIFVKEGHHENETVWWEELFKDRRKVEVRCSFRPGGRHTRVWHLTFDCFKAQAGNRVYVSVRELNQTLITASPTVIHPQVRVFPVPRFPVNHRSGSDEGKDTVPVYNLKVDILAKRFLVTMAEGQNVKVRLCFKNFQRECSGARPHQVHKVNTDLNRTISLNFTHLVPCMCVQLYYFSLDAKRDTACPLKDKTLPGGGDVLSSSSLIPFGSSVLQWKPLCPSAQSKPSVALCWQQPENQSHCVHVQNSTLVETELSYNVSQVDKHPHMCVKFSLNESRRVFCPYSSGLIPKWEVTVVLGPQGLRVQLSSSVQAVFAAQLCVRENEACVAIGNVHSVLMKQDARHGELSIPLSSSSSGLCVQVWQAVPALLGRRTICPDYSHRRWGLILAVSLAFLVTVTTLGILTYNMIKKKTSVWRRSERKPVLLVCSSDDVAHVAAVCALASGLQEELCVDVRLAHWTHCSTQASLARLGPVPWLYGQCQAVQQAGGVVLVAWSADALRAFLRWREGQVEEMEHRWSGKETWTERAREASSVVAPVFIAALASLWTGLHSERRGEGFGLIDFRGLGGSCYVPKDLRGVRRYCLPRDLSSLVHELDLKARGPGGVKAAVSQWCCWPRLISKVLSSWLSQRLAQRLEACLPQADERARLASERTLPLKSDSGKNTKLKQKIRLLTDDPDSMEYNETSEKEQLGMPA